MTQAQGAPRTLFGVTRPGILGKHPSLLRGVPLGRVTSYVVVFTDALLMGWGGTCLSHSVGGEWLTPPTAHINVLELADVRKVLLHFFQLVSGRHVLIRTDNVYIVYINRQGGVRWLLAQ